MNVLDYLDSECILLDVKAKNKKAAISLIVDHLVQKKKIAKKDKPAVVRAIFRREEMGSTAIGNHIAFPHARVSSVKDIVICLAVSKEGIDFDSLDQEPVNIIALLLSNQSEAGLHLKMLAFLARMLRDKYLVQRLKTAKERPEVVALLRQQQQAIG
ncbi:MAG: PTS sugar transporter subunit IIA [Candidatus Omnitrophica bacterium]|nr:PTS sugar transporter subunit IIA [Candidatus Omnitrophota bacterium]MBU2044178.1 PTS sugar transporter subunit IIA [Candidatus Omnitrophota bacterium]MBU2251034.1 PTS sugar transporter subunit IIA [Candidatus Omnitrophota bacterium]MBU2473510.1 PTS sugar transporter subunit IIA [Candidatus Omnitrophota bacterium]